MAETYVKVSGGHLQDVSAIYSYYAKCHSGEWWCLSLRTCGDLGVEEGREDTAGRGRLFGS